MMANNQSSSFDRPNQVFRGIRFVLLGFDPTNKAQVLRKLVDGGGVDVGQYGPNCTHVIVDKLAYDDPMCLAARRDGKILVSSIWVDHSFDVGVPVDTTSVMYRPVKDLNGIPGAQSLVICLTGYQRQDREDIMTMVALMGARFSKPLIANKVTHLICYKFEGEKYLLAKKMKIIKLINHRWLEDCLKAWEIISEADYSKSGYELEMEAEAKDSEDEAEGVAARHYEGKTSSPHHSVAIKQEVSESLLNTSASKVKTASPHHSLAFKQEFSGNVLNTSASKASGNAENTVSATIKSTSDQFSNPQDSKKLIDATCEPCELFEGTSSGSVTENNISAATTKLGKKSPLNEAKKVVYASYSRQTTPPTVSTTSSLSSTKRPGKLNLRDAFNFPFSFVENMNDGTKVEKSGLFYGKRKMDVSCSSSKLQRTSHNETTPNRESPHVDGAFQELKDCPAETSNVPYLKDQVGVNPEQNPVFNISATKPSSSKANVTREMPISNSLAPEIGQGEYLDAVQIPPKETKVDTRDVGIVRPTHVVQKLQNEVQSVDKLSPALLNSDLEKSSTSKDTESSSNPIKKKSVEKKILSSYRSEGKTKTANQKGSIYLKNSELKNDAGTSTVEVPRLADDENDGLQIKNMSANKSLCTDDETEPPEDKEEADKEKQQHIEPEKTVDMVMEKKAEVDQNNDKDEDMSKSGNLITSATDKVMVDKADDKNLLNDKTSRGKKLPLIKKAKKKTVLSAKEVTDKKAAEKKELAGVKNNRKPENKKESTQRRATKTKGDDNVNNLENPMEVEGTEGVRDNAELNNDEKNEVEAAKSADTENFVHQKATKRKKRPLSKAKKDSVLSVKEVTDGKTINKRELASDDKNNEKLAKKGKPSSSRAVKVCDLENFMEAQKENRQIPIDDQSTGSKLANKSASELPEKIIPKSDMCISKTEPMWFIFSGHKLQRREFQQIIKRLKGRICRVSHQWSYQATHFIVPDPIRRTEKFFAAAASGRWILKTDYLSASNQAGKFLAEEPYEWHKNGLSEDGQINLEAPRKWRLLKQKTGHGAFYGMHIIIYGECIAPPLDTLKRVVKAGDGTILATSPPYTRFLDTNIDFAIVSPGIPCVDTWVQEFLTHEIPCVSADYLVEYVCKPGYPLEKHIQYDTNTWAERSYNNLKNRLEEDMNEPRTPDSNDIHCEVCGSRDRGEEMLICGDESGLTGCGVGTHIDCCDPPLADIPEEDWFCHKCKKVKNMKTSTSKKSSKRKGK